MRWGQRAAGMLGVLVIMVGCGSTNVLGDSDTREAVCKLTITALGVVGEKVLHDATLSEASNVLEPACKVALEKMFEQPARLVRFQVSDSDGRTVQRQITLNELRAQLAPPPTVDQQTQRCLTRANGSKAVFDFCMLLTPATSG